MHVHGNNERRMMWAALLTAVFMVVEVVGGVVSGSLALLADAAHMLTDAASLGLAWLAFRWARRPSDARRTYGFHRLQILVAFANGVSLFVLLAWIAAEAIQRFADPVPIEGGVMLGVAVAGLAVNLAAFGILHGAERGNLNVRGAALHVLGDLAGSAAALAAALTVIWTGWTPIDPILSLAVAALIAVSAWRLVRQAGHILLEGAPEGLDLRELESDLVTSLPDVEDVHHIHAWSLTEKKKMVTLHATARAGAKPDAVASCVQERLRNRFGVDHATVQVEEEACPDESLERPCR